MSVTKSTPADTAPVPASITDPPKSTAVSTPDPINPAPVLKTSEPTPTMPDPRVPIPLKRPLPPELPLVGVEI